MIVAAVDDLLFSSKIRATAGQVGAEVTFARTQEELLRQARAGPPRLIVVDLNTRGLDPLAAIAAVKAEPALAGVRLLAFVAHVRADLIEAARAAGADEVLARSAFAGNLAQILA